MGDLLHFPAASTPHAVSSTVGEPAKQPAVEALPVIPAHRLHRIFAPRPLIEWTTPEAYAPQVTVTWPARLLVGAVMGLVTAYCAAIWATGGAL
jgi:hypothetical protein